MIVQGQVGGSVGGILSLDNQISSPTVLTMDPVAAKLQKNV